MRELQEGRFHEFLDVVEETPVEELTQHLWPDDPEYDPKAHMAPLAERHFNSEATQWAWMNELKNNVDEYRWVYDRLQDPVSRDTLTSIMHYRLSWNGDDLTQTQRMQKYFDWALLNRPDDAVYVDAGAYDGGSVVNFVNTYGDEYKSIHAFEPFDRSYEMLAENLSDLRDASLNKQGLWDETKTLTYAGKGQSVTVATPDSEAKPDGTIEAVKLDDYLDEEPSLIKMDIEGAEAKAIRGAYNSIKAGLPELAICAYHLMDDLRTLPRLITEIDDDYALSLRNYKTRGSAEIVLYARSEK
jgi:FkbM family methyltransferase